MIDLASTFHDVVRIAREASDPESGWDALLQTLARYAKNRLPSKPPFFVSRDVQAIRAQLETLVRMEPPPSTLNAIYFGLFDTADEQGAEGIGYYVAGIARYDPHDEDALVAPAWWPERRYLQSSTLNGVKAMELAAAAAGDVGGRLLLGYAGQLGTALLVSKFAANGLFEGLVRVVGFDSGDFAEIA